MPPSSALTRLAERIGISPSYEDVFGKTHEASQEALRAVLAALGFDARDDAAAEAALDAFEARRWRSVLEPVYVLAADGDARVDCAFDERANERELRWTLSREDGVEVGGSCIPSALRAVERGSADGIAFARRTLALPGSLPLGYHRLVVDWCGERHAATLVVAPPACWLTPELESGRAWGLAVQVYALRSQRNWGVGDFTDLQTLCAIVREAGGAAVAVNPLHWIARGETSPYGPASREFANWLYLDASKLPGALPEDAPADDIARALAERYVDYDAAYAALWRAARIAFDRFVAMPRGAAHDAFESFVARGGETLREAAIFAALAEQFGATHSAADWRTWPEPYRDPASEAVAAFARERADDVAFFAYLQWQTDAQLAEVARACGGMPIGLYRDLAVGSHLGGFDTWRAGNAFCSRAAAGAPPDLLNRSGQNWGVAPFHPIALREAGYAPFAELVRANVAHAGALRIDHVIGLLRLWFVPEGFSASDGAYVGYRLDEMLAVLALESVRGRFAVVGEDLGTVPEGFRERLERANVLSYRVLQFEHDDERFFAPDAYPEVALVATGTHDLPTMAAYWRGADLELRERVGALASDAVAAERELRARRLAQLRAAFAREGLDASDPSDAEIGRIANLFLARTPARLLVVQLEDVLGETEQINVPATTHEHPNWRRRNGIDVAALASDDRFVTLARELRDTRGARRAIPLGE